MFETIFKRPAVVARYTEGPLLEARKQFLYQCKRLGYSLSMIKKIAWVLLSVAYRINLHQDKITAHDIELAVEGRSHFKRSSNHSQIPRSSRQLFIQIVTEWVRSLGCFEAPPKAENPFAAQIDAFKQYLHEERGLSSITIATRCERLARFFDSLQPTRNSLRTITSADVQLFIDTKGKQGWSRSSLAALAGSLRSFFRYAEVRGWCVPAIADVIESPRLYVQEGLPKGPSWEDVQRLLASTRGDRPSDIRAHAILMLLAVYGLRRGEVARLRLDDVDWIGEQIAVSRPKQRRIQHYPMTAEVGHAILGYLQQVRPRCTNRALFLALTAPVRPLSASSITAIVRSRLQTLGINLPRRGAHCLRHACAGHLLASGFSLKQIGDHLGHRSANATLTYTKVDLAGLRAVAELDLGRLL